MQRVAADGAGVEVMSCDPPIDNGPNSVEEYEAWMDSPDYQAFVEDVAKYCRCSHGPCDGVLAGGMCDELDLADGDDDE